MGEELLCSTRHEINYWFSDALMGLKAIFQLLLNVQCYCIVYSLYLMKVERHSLLSLTSTVSVLP